MRPSILTADEQSIRLIDGLVIAWLVIWLTIGLWSAWTVWHLADLGDTLATSGRALNTAGTALVDIGGLPVVGDKAGQLGADVVTTAAEVSKQGRQVTGEMHQLALQLGISVALMPTTPVVGLYLPLRLARRREIRDLRRALSTHPGDRSLDRYLAARALDNLSFTELRSISDDPWGDFSTGDPTALADSELARLGLTRAEQ